MTNFLFFRVQVHGLYFHILINIKKHPKQYLITFLPFNMNFLKEKSKLFLENKLKQIKYNQVNNIIHLIKINLPKRSSVLELLKVGKILIYLNNKPIKSVANLKKLHIMRLFFNKN